MRLFRSICLFLYFYILFFIKSLSIFLIVFFFAFLGG